MRVTIISAGKLKESYLRAGIGEFKKRLRPFTQLSFMEINEEKMPAIPSAKEKEKILLLEGKRLLKQVPKGDFLFVLDVYGKQFSSIEFAEKINVLAISGKSNLSFIVGGTFGLSNELRKKADSLVSFSKMTFTHQMVKLLLVEQIYRAFKINHGEPYNW